MNNVTSLITVLLVSSLSWFSCSCAENKSEKTGNFSIGWASADITPDEPVLLKGQRHARISEGIMDPVTATVLALESGTGPSSRKVLMISCDLVGISDGMRDGSSDNLRDKVRKQITGALPELAPEQVILNATHTHTAPWCSSDTGSKTIHGVDLDVMSPKECMTYISERITEAASQAWKGRRPGGISYGLGHAVTGNNRLQVDFEGKSRKTGSTDRPGFSHIEGYEDHSVNLLYTWDRDLNLTGVVINVAMPSQASGGAWVISADYWHETRTELRKRLGRDLFILPQCSAAGDQQPFIMVGAEAEERMRQIMGDISFREQIAIRIADAVTSVLPYMKENINWDPEFEHRMEKVALSRRLISMEEVNRSEEEAVRWKKKYEQMMMEIQENPGITEKPRWYADVTRTYNHMTRAQSVPVRFELEKTQPALPVEVHVLRIGDIAVATNPFELYLDYGIRIKARSPAVQTFVVQLTGGGTYLPTSRSVAGGAYGAIPSSTLIGPEGGQELVERTLGIINEFWAE